MLAAAALCLVFPLVAVGESTLEEVLAGRLASQPEPSSARASAILQAIRTEYAARDYRPLWLGDRRPTAAARESVLVLQRSFEHGLDPRHYQASWLAETMRSLGAGNKDLQSMAGWDLAMTSSVARFLVDLQVGRVDGARFGFPKVSLDRIRSLVEGSMRRLAAEPLSVLAESTACQLPQYQSLLPELARFRSLARSDLNPRQLPDARGGVLHEGDEYAAVRELIDILRAYGALAGADEVDPTHIGPQVALALRRFQMQSGLQADGVLGPATLAQLRVPFAQRVMQIELALERWRWIGQQDEPYVIVNLPQFTLFAYAAGASQDVPLAMRVVIGQDDERWRTPQFSAVITEVIFNPFWDVPVSIATRELLPLERAHPGYLTRNGFEAVTVDGRTSPARGAALVAVANGSMRLRQRPGAGNALGRIKFRMPNDYGVYLHDTPAKDLFDTACRAYSHGCLRLAEPSALAQFVLGHGLRSGGAEWPAGRIREVMAAEETINLRLERPLRFHAMYLTAQAGADGVAFFPDIYGLDSRLARTVRDAP
ncbi:MAG: L,D-transpeptidase family protein [Steroidobacteraceae bacterium]